MSMDFASRRSTNLFLPLLCCGGAILDQFSCKVRKGEDELPRCLDAFSVNFKNIVWF